VTATDLVLPGVGHTLHDRLASARTTAPVVWSDAHKAWIALSHAAVAEGFRDPRFSSDRLPAFERLAETRPTAFRAVVDLLSGWMVFRDPPAHTRLREPVRAAFTPRRVAHLESSIEAIVDGLLDDLEDRGRERDGPGADLRAVVGQPLPAIVIAELLGVPAADRLQFQRWSDELGRIVFAAESRHVDDGAAIAGATSFAAYFGDLVEQRRRSPRDDLISAVVAAAGREDVGLSPAELVGACAMLLFAGHSTTTAFLSNALWSLFEHPEALAQWRTDPTLDSTAVDELLRFEGPASVMIRRALVDLEFHGADVRAGDTVYLSISSANRDPFVFADPDRLDLRREPNPHLGFGWGLHHCLGAPLARLETRIVVRRLLDRFPEIGPVGAPAWGDNVIGHGSGPLVVQLRAD
jgi:cytochrome P450